MLSDYVTAKDGPKNGDTLVPYLKTYAYTPSYTEEETGHYYGTPTLVGTAESNINCNNTDYGKLIVEYRDSQNNHKLTGGDYKITPLTGTGTKKDMEHMPYGKYLVKRTLAPEGYKPIGLSQKQVEINATTPENTVVFLFEKENLPTPIAPKKIPFTNKTPVLAPDHPTIFISIEDENVHPINGLKVSIIGPEPNTEEHPLTDYKVNNSEETQHRLLAIPVSKIIWGKGKYKILLQQVGYKDTEVPFLLAERTQRPAVATENKGYVYRLDGSFSIKGDKNSNLTITFLKNPRSEEDLIELEADKITSDENGKFTANFSHLIERLKEHNSVKIVAQSPGKAPSDIIITALRDTKSTEEYRDKQVNKPEINIIVTPIEGYHGTPLTIKGYGYTPGRSILFELHSIPITLGSAVADRNGTVILKTNIPTNISTGIHKVILTELDDSGAKTQNNATATLRVLEKNKPTDSKITLNKHSKKAENLAATGSSVIPALLFAIILLFTGNLLLYRRKFNG